MNLVNIENYEELYKFDKDQNKIYNVKTKKYIKNSLKGKHYSVSLYKDGKIKQFRLNKMICKYNKDKPDDLVDIDGYENYKFDLSTNYVFNINTKEYLKNFLSSSEYYKVVLTKNNKQKHFQLHRLIFKSHNPLINIEGLCIDHINQDKLDNNIDNLRIATRSENSCNVKPRTNNKLGIKNIFKNKSNTFTVKINKDGKKYSKNFETLDEAIEHRDLKLKELHKEFASF